jgi:hypothetical protein
VPGNWGIFSRERMGFAGKWRTENFSLSGLIKFYERRENAKVSREWANFKASLRMRTELEIVLFAKQELEVKNYANI